MIIDYYLPRLHCKHLLIFAKHPAWSRVLALQQKCRVGLVVGPSNGSVLQPAVELQTKVRKVFTVPGDEPFWSLLFVESAY